MLFVLREIGVEQVNRVAPDIDPPRAEADLARRDANLADDGIAVGIQQRLHRQVERVEQVVEFSLPVVIVDRLLEVAFAVEKADPDKADAQIAG